VAKLGHLARSTVHLLEIASLSERKGVALRILGFGGEAVSTSGPTGKIQLTVFGTSAQFEREMMLKRQREGIAKAKAAGKYRGRKHTALIQSNEVSALRTEGASGAEIALRLRIGRASVYRILASAETTSAGQRGGNGNGSRKDHVGGVLP
jgi:DNA invertase Pin-like site-specific DNA recombinase